MLCRAATTSPVDVIRPFRAIPGPRGAALGFDYAVPVDALDERMPEGIRRLRACYRQQRQPLRIEFNEELWSPLAVALDSEGFALQTRNPLMACNPSEFRPREAGGVEVRWIDRDKRYTSTQRVDAAVDGIIAGLASIGDLDGVAELYGVTTEPAYRRRGVAATLCSALISRHFEEGGTLVFLDAENAGAAALYAGLGFRAIGTRLTYAEPV